MILVPGSFLFTSIGEFIGLVIGEGADRAIVPATLLLAEAERLVDTPPAPAGRIGITIQPLTAAVAAVTGATAGVVVTWVDPAGAAMGHLLVGDVIEAVQDRATTREAWQARVARISAGQSLELRVRRRGEVRQVTLVARAEHAPVEERPLGLTLRRRARIGAEVIRVEPASAADDAGLAVGDVVTLIGDAHAPTPQQVTRSFAATAKGGRVLVGVTRGDTHFVTTVER